MCIHIYAHTYISTYISGTGIGNVSVKGPTVSLETMHLSLQKAALDNV